MSVCRNGQAALLLLLLAALAGAALVVGAAAVAVYVEATSCVVIAGAEPVVDAWDATPATVQVQIGYCRGEWMQLLFSTSAGAPATACR